MTDGVLTLQEAADELGVHYMTAYRYVRLGVMEASKSGGVWQVQRVGPRTVPSEREASSARDRRRAVRVIDERRGRRGSSPGSSPVTRLVRGV